MVKQRLKAQRVAVIGAGVSGVAAAIQLQQAGLEVCVYERTKKVGGVWVYNDRTAQDPSYPSTAPSYGDTDDEALRRMYTARESCKVDSPLSRSQEDLAFEAAHAPPGPCYQGLKNNVSMIEMEMRALNWTDDANEFVPHYRLADYIARAAEENGIIDKIRFSTRVLDMSKTGSKWTVQSVTVVGEGAREILRSTEAYDAVIVAIGHYHACHIPDIPGLAAWKAKYPDRVLHSKGYRQAERFRDQNVLLVGAGVSSTDIAKEIAPIARSVVQVSRGGMYDLPSSMLPTRVCRVGAIRSFDALRRDSTRCQDETLKDPISANVTLESGERLCDIHQVVLCTGYHVSIPFLRSFHADEVAAADADELVLVTNGQQTHNLHKDIFYIPDPTLAFVGVPYHVATFSLFEFQAITIAAVFAGRASLPDEHFMRTEYNERLVAKGSGRTFHSLKAEGAEDAYVGELVALVNGELIEADTPSLGAEKGSMPGLAEMTGHTSRWHHAYQRRLSRLRAVRSIERSKTGEELARQRVASCV